MIDYILLFLGAASVILLIVLLISVKQNQNKNTAREITDSLNSALSDTRRELSQSNEALRISTQNSVSALANAVSSATEQTVKYNIDNLKAMNELRERTDSAARIQTQAVSQAVEKLQASNEKKLDEMRATVDEKLSATLGERLDSSFKTVSEQLSNVYKSLGEMKEISGGINTLNRVLTGVKTRGTWAETQLEGILDDIIPNMYVKNYAPEGSRDFVEFAVKIPDRDGNISAYMPIDSKFPAEDYLRLCEAVDSNDPEGIKQSRKALEQRVLAQAKEIKKYITPPETTPFAVLYLATDSLYAEIMSSSSGIADRIHSEYSVLPAGPSTIAALLSSLSLGFRTVALNKKAGEVMDLLGAAKLQYDKFGDALQKAKKKIDEAGRSIDEADSRNRVILKKLKGVEAIEQTQADSLLGTDLLSEEDTI